MVDYHLSIDLLHGTSQHRIEKISNLEFSLIEESIRGNKDNAFKIIILPGLMQSLFLNEGEIPFHVGYVTLVTQSVVAAAIGSY